MTFKSSDPLQRLPYEAWVQFIQLYAHGQPEGPLPLLAVSSNWQRRLLAAAELWTTIYLDGGHDEQCRAECFFHLSGTFLVELIVDRNCGEIETFAHHSDRIKSLVFQTRPEILYSSRDVSLLSRKLARQSYSRLLHIHVDPPSNGDLVIPMDLIKSCPALVGIHGAYLDRDTIPYLAPSTTMFGIIGDGMLPRGIGDRMEVLRVLCLPSKSKNPLHSDYFTIPTIRLRSFELSFLGRDDWPTGRLSFAEDSNYLLPIRAFTSTIHWGLKMLRIAMPWYDIALIVPCLSACKTLREVWLSVFVPVEMDRERNDPIVDVGNLGHIRMLSLSHASGTVKPQLHLITALLAQGSGLQNLQELRLDFRSRVDWSLKVPDYLATTKNLTELHLPGFLLSKPHKDFKKVQLSRLHTLVIQDGTTIEYLDCPILAHLTCSSWYIDPDTQCSVQILESNLESITAPGPLLHDWNGSRSFITDVNKKPLSRLLTLRLLNGHFRANPTQPLNFSNLRSISFEEAYYISPDLTEKLTGKSMLNHFMLEILLSPDNCPCLHTIRSTKFPSWALATATLHRRNSLKAVTPITSFWLHGYPQTVVLANLINALNAIDEDPGPSICVAAWFDQVIKRRSEIPFL
jgi:hypothetical protein